MPTNHPTYDFIELEDHLAHVCEPGRVACHLDSLLYYLVYYHHKEGIGFDWEIYSDIHGLKQILERIENGKMKVENGNK